MTLDEFLLARIAEDQERAEHDIDHFGDTPDNRDKWIVKLSTKALAECEAKRRIIAVHPPDREVDDKWVQCDSCSDWQAAGSVADSEPVAWPCPTLRFLAAVYADHPDYDPEWRIHA